MMGVIMMMVVGGDDCCGEDAGCINIPAVQKTLPLTTITLHSSINLDYRACRYAL